MQKLGLAEGQSVVLLVMRHPQPFEVFGACCARLLYRFARVCARSKKAQKAIFLFGKLVLCETSEFPTSPSFFDICRQVPSFRDLSLKKCF